MTNHPLLSFNHISITDDGAQGARVLLDDVSGVLYGGNKVVLTGASGAGKSVLLSALAGQIPLTQGQVLLNTQTVQNQAMIPPQVWRHQVALLTQTPVMMDGMVLDNLKLPYRFSHHKNQHFDEHQHLAWLSRFGKSADFIHQDITKLSGGERQIVHFLRMLQLKPTVLLLDEPTAALDTVSAGVLMTLVHEWLDAHRAYIWISHRTDEVDMLGAISWQMTTGRLECAQSDGLECV